MELQKIERSIPVKAIPEQELNEIILLHFTPWLCNLLSLTGETSAERLEVALPAIKEHCWSMGFDEIKKMFELFADNKLSVEPIPNYFDRILFGKIVKSYKDQKPNKKVDPPKQQLSEEDKELIFLTGVLTVFENYKETKKLTGITSHIYDHFYEKKKFPKHTNKFKKQVAERAYKALEKEHKDNSVSQTGIKKYMESIQGSGLLKIKCKEIILSDWFDELIEKGIDIKDEL